MLSTQLPDRPDDRTPGERPTLGNKERQLLHERLLRAVHVAASPDPLPPHDPHPRHAGHVVKHAVATSTRGRDDPARRAPGRCRRCRDGDDQQIVATVDVLNVDTVQAE